ncbi:MAG TPA: ferritin family protein [Bacteroidales bacterium]|nr:ferritin family protein [Bacteroidales bacterium]HRZ50182.1 ferritin family protein [Bacteroidales bacterium]
MQNEKALDILKTAILLERRGKAFYSQVAATTRVPEAREVFTIMAEEEQAHIDFLSEQYKSLLNNQTFSKQRLADSHANEAIVEKILNEGIKGKIEAASYEAAAIGAAINMESSAIQVYSERAAEATDLNEKELYAWLADWEQSHLKMLNEMNKQLMESIWYDNQFWPF